MRGGWRIACVLTLVALTSACRRTLWQAEFQKPEERAKLDVEAPFLKCHVQDGGVYVLADWTIHENLREVRGTGRRYDADRGLIEEGPLRVPYERIVLLETNRPQEVRRNTTQLVVLGVLTMASAGLTAACVAQPKACFGSCPTFYVRGRDGWLLQAEGFSGSFARVLESRDVDALPAARPEARRFELRMVNEALETHAVRDVRLLTVPRAATGAVLRAGETFYSITREHEPQTCTTDAGTCLVAVRAGDGLELHHPADPHDLTARERVELVFPARPGAAGLVLDARMSLVSTFLFYQVLAYMGRSAGERMADLERGDPAARRALEQMMERFGGIDAWVRDVAGEWIPAGRFYEAGPIARDRHLLPLPPQVSAGAESLHVRLEMARGHWRIDRVGLAELGPTATPTEILPSRAEWNGHDSREVLARLLDPDAYVVTYPGDVVILGFDLPDTRSVELFLSSRGYYYEWLRLPWLAEEDPAEVARLLVDPDGFLRRMAPAFKLVEPDAERVFWSSRVGCPP